MTEIMFYGTLKRMSTVQRRVRSTEAYALVRSIKYMYSGIKVSAPTHAADESRTSYRW